MCDISVFLYFPEKDDDLLSFNKSDIQRIANEIGIIKSNLSRNCTIYFDSDNIKTFKDITTFLEFDKDEYFTNLFENIKKLIGTHSIDVKSTSLAKSDCFYIYWDINDFSVKSQQPRLVKNAAEKKLSGDDVVLVSFSDLIERDFLSIIKDAKHYNELPLLVKIPFFNPVSTFVEWYKRRKDSSFSIANVERFSRTNFIYCRNGSKQRIYEENGTGRYWYYDYFHKNNKEHYEVFDSQGNHIGEADIEGNIIPKTKDNNKSIKQYLK